MEGLGWSFPDTRLTCKVRKVMGSEVVGRWPVGLYCQPQSLSSGLWILDLDLGLTIKLIKRSYLELVSGCM